jgi:hypothetical protein
MIKCRRSSCLLKATVLLDLSLERADYRVVPSLDSWANSLKGEDAKLPV